MDDVIESTGLEHKVDAPKDLETLEKISAINNEKRANEEKEDDDDENIKLNIGDDVQIHMDTINLSSAIELDDDPILDGVEFL